MSTGTRSRVAALAAGALIVVGALAGCGISAGSPTGASTAAQGAGPEVHGRSATPSTPTHGAGVPTRSTTPTPTPAPTSARTATPEPASKPTPPHGAGSALAAAAALPVKGRAPRTGYDRDDFGPAWQDVDRNGCDTRNDILGRDLVDAGYKPRTRECVLAYGTLHDRYSGHDVHFVRGPNSADVQIDHVVALSDAWQKGAQQWDDERRAAFANDPLNLLAADGPLNQSKGDGDAATWLPPHKAFRCEYVARQVAVKTRYGLWVTRAESAAMQRVLSTCPTRKLPTGDPVPGPGGAKLGRAPATQATQPPREPPNEAASDVPYANCTAAWAAGAAPVRVGDPGYSRRLDRDGDGVGCEFRP
ncbi:GmrSD restriction endonuclease domain-containing protein [Cellulomonas edaphi]|uniref:DUF1524 domain-containing protein n=1 Tax=Cellulomonas edaphi TaxID=3053468 RepID=A0ABT7S3P8_9CELL|nr:DUF1524 domain-containing protein [Cellulomons edaphi]MDM7830245.1 DUF1524 domain-containing protein [Cellulomons edaphi]